MLQVCLFGMALKVTAQELPSMQFKRNPLSPEQFRLEPTKKPVTPAFKNRQDRFTKACFPAGDIPSFIQYHLGVRVSL